MSLTNITTSIIARPVRLDVILEIMSVSTFITDVILYGNKHVLVVHLILL